MHGLCHLVLLCAMLVVGMGAPSSPTPSSPVNSLLTSPAPPSPLNSTLTESRSQFFLSFPTASFTIGDTIPSLSHAFTSTDVLASAIFANSTSSGAERGARAELMCLVAGTVAMLILQ